jgi:hypothetical protein
MGISTFAWLTRVEGVLFSRPRSVLRQPCRFDFVFCFWSLCSPADLTLCWHALTSGIGTSCMLGRHSGLRGGRGWRRGRPLAGTRFPFFSYPRIGRVRPRITSPLPPIGVAVSFFQWRREARAFAPLHPQETVLFPAQHSTLGPPTTLPCFSKQYTKGVDELRALDDVCAACFRLSGPDRRGCDRVREAVSADSREIASSPVQHRSAGPPAAPNGFFFFLRLFPSDFIFFFSSPAKSGRREPRDFAKQ